MMTHSPHRISMPIWKEPILLLLMRSGISIVLPAVDMVPLLFFMVVAPFRRGTGACLSQASLQSLLIDYSNVIFEWIYQVSL